MIPELSRSASVYAYDRRGFGESLAGDKPFTHLEDLEELMNQLDIESAWLVGSSAGGKLALNAALEMPHRVEGLVLVSTAVSGAPPWDDADVDRQTEEIDELITQADERGDLEEVNRWEVRLWLDGPREYEGRVSGPVRKLVTEMNAIALSNFIPESVDQAAGAWSRLGELSMPVSVSCGKLDATHIIRRNQVIAARIPGARYTALDGVAHLPYLENSSAISSLILEFL